MIAHIAGVPVEENLLPLVSGVGGVSTGLLLARVWVASHVRRPRHRGHGRHEEG